MNDITLMYQNIDDQKWEDSFLDFVNIVLEYLNIDNWEFSITLCDDKYIHKLNKEYREKDKPTDVITFVMSDEPFPMESLVGELYSAGDIIISMDTVKENSTYFKVEYEEELKRVLIHGILHLKGLNHESNDDEEDMLILQEKIMLAQSKRRIF